MCYASPGPRCSSHARADLKSAQSAEASALTLLEAASTLVQRLNTRLGDTLEAGSAHKAERARQEDDYSRLLDDYWRAKENLVRAREVYESTPEGIAGLKDELLARQQELPGNFNDDREYQDLAYRLEIGQDTRARQLAAFKARHGDNAPAPSGDPEDEVEAAAAPPPCTCIEYRYQSTCSHVATKIALTRRRLLPTSNEAALDAHAAATTYHLRRNEARTIATTPRARTAHVRGQGLVPEQREADAAVTEAWKAMQRAQATFYATPAGQALIEAKIKDGARSPAFFPDDDSPTGYRLGTWAEAYTEAQRTRVHNEAEYHSLLADSAAQSGVTENENELTQRIEDSDEVNHTPPDILYANPCPHRCPDFTWVGDCAHLGGTPFAITSKTPTPSTGTTTSTVTGTETGTTDRTSAETGTGTGSGSTGPIASALPAAIDAPEVVDEMPQKSLVDRLLGRF